MIQDGFEFQIVKFSEYWEEIFPEYFCTHFFNPGSRNGTQRKIRGIFLFCRGGSSFFENTHG
jgi:hypothetical protein